MLVKSERSKSTYQVSHVKREPVRGKVVTKFSIRDQVRGLPGEFVSIGITVWDDIAIKDGDYIRLLDYDNLVASYYPPKKRINFFMSAIVEVVPQTDADMPVGNPFK